MSPSKPYRRLVSKALPELQTIRRLIQQETLTPSQEEALRHAIALVHQKGLEQNVQSRAPLGHPFMSLEEIVSRFIRWRGHLPPVPPEQHGSQIRIRWNCVGDAFLISTLLRKVAPNGHVGTIIMPGHMVTTLRTNSGKTFVIDGSRVIEAEKYRAELLHAAESVRANPSYSGRHVRPVKAMNLHLVRRPETVLQRSLIQAGSEGAHAAAHYNLGRYYLRESDPMKALHHFRRAFELVPDFFQAWRESAMALHDGVQPLSLAIKHVEQALRLNPHDPQSHAVLAQVMLTQYRRYGRIAHRHKARVHVRKALRIDRQHALALAVSRELNS